MMILCIFIAAVGVLAAWGIGLPVAIGCVATVSVTAFLTRMLRDTAGCWDRPAGVIRRLSHRSDMASAVKRIAWTYRLDAAAPHVVLASTRRFTSNPLPNVRSLIPPGIRRARLPLAARCA